MKPCMILLTLLALVGGRKVGHVKQGVTQLRQEVTPEPQLSELDDKFEYRNPDFTDDGLPLFESDMILTVEQKDSRQAVTNLWTSPVRYAITSTSAGDRAAIEAGLDHWRTLTCIEFTEVSEGASGAHLSFIKGGGCWSYVGKSSSGAQQISIGNGCTGLGTVAHEIGHAMGLYHQQSRTDRDAHVIINLQNVQSGKGGNFNMASNSLTHSVPYDLTSVMHYGSHYFSSNGQATIQVRDIALEGLIGSRAGLSHRDQQIANIMYQCADSCASPPTCQNGGFVNKDCGCTCPHHTSGSNCETLEGTYYPAPVCGDADMQTEGTITSPNYPANFPTNVDCLWVITAGVNQQVKVTVTDMKMLYRHTDGVCHWDYISMRYSGDIYVDDQTGCDEEFSGQSFTSTGNQFIFKFVSGNYGWHRGFTASVEFIGEAVTTTAPPETTTSPPETTTSPAETTTSPAETTTAPSGGNCGGARRLP